MWKLNVIVARIAFVIVALDATILNISNILNTKYSIILDDVVKFKTKMSLLYEYLEKMQIFYEEFDMEKWDGIIVIKN